MTKLIFGKPTLWPLRLAVRTVASHAINTGSIPVGVSYFATSSLDLNLDLPFSSLFTIRLEQITNRCIG